MPHPLPPATPRSRRAVLGLLGAAPVAASGLLAAAEPTNAEESRHGPIPRGLRPGGESTKRLAPSTSCSPTPQVSAGRPSTRSRRPDRTSGTASTRSGTAPWRSCARCRCGSPLAPSSATATTDTSYQPTGGRVDTITTRYFSFIGGPHTGAYSSAPDMVRFATALHAGRLLGPAFTQLIISGKVPTPPGAMPAPSSESRFYGYGHFDAIVGGQRVVGHSGGGAGRSNNLDVFPGLDWIAVVLSNYDTGVRPTVELARQLITRDADR